MTAHSSEPVTVQACIFDAYGTLLDFNSAVAEERVRLGGDADRLSELWRRKQLEYTWLRTLMHAHLDFFKVTGDALDFALQALKLEDPALRDRLMGSYRRLSSYPEVTSMLQQLRSKGFKLAILSNGEPDMLQAGCDAAGLTALLDAILSVEDVGVFKPAPEVYQLACAEFGLPAKACAFLSSNGWDAQGAAQFGFQTIWINRAGAPRENLPGTLRAELSDLTTLPQLLSLG